MAIASTRPSSGSARNVKPVEGTPSGGPDRESSWIRAIDSRIASGEPPSHFATRAYIVDLLESGESTLRRAGGAVNDATVTVQGRFRGGSPVAGASAGVEPARHARSSAPPPLARRRRRAAGARRPVPRLLRRRRAHRLGVG